MVMGKLKIEAKDLRALGFAQDELCSQLLTLVRKSFKHTSKEAILKLLQDFLQNPSAYYEDSTLGAIAEKYVPRRSEHSEGQLIEGKEGVPFSVFGGDTLEPAALHQMYQASKLPVSVAGAIMPDGHFGYGLPIGGVLGTENAVIPYGVGLDIGCRMCLSVFPLSPSDMVRNPNFFSRLLQEQTLFGGSAQFDKSPEHPVMDKALFKEMPLLRNLHTRAWKQLGSSGSGNHFVEFGEVVVEAKDALLGLEPGSYIGLLSHSGSRTLGAKIADYYTNIAIQSRRLSQDIKHMAWLYLNEPAGAEYWEAMNLAGDYASACHEVIHAKIARELGCRYIARIENHHNFAWKESWNGRELIVHRKGATPAGKDVAGIIPGSMTAPGFIVKGKGNPESLSSASHGAGRQLSRSDARQSITGTQLKEALRSAGVTLLGGEKDEAPFAYKDIHQVMAAQQSLVEVMGTFFPKIVRMNGKERW